MILKITWLYATLDKWIQIIFFLKVLTTTMTTTMTIIISSSFRSKLNIFSLVINFFDFYYSQVYDASSTNN